MRWFLTGFVLGVAGVVLVAVWPELRYWRSW